MKQTLRDNRGFTLIEIMVVIVILALLAALVGPKIMGNATTELFNGVMKQIAGTGGIDFNAIGRILLLVGIVKRVI